MDILVSAQLEICQEKQDVVCIWCMSAVKNLSVCAVLTIITAAELFLRVPQSAKKHSNFINAKAVTSINTSNYTYICKLKVKYRFLHYNHFFE